MNRAAGAATALVAVLVTSLVTGAPAVGQQLVLKREIPNAAFTCSTEVDTGTGVVTDADRQEAARLSSAATQASIVGDHAGARDLLLRASRLDPAAADVSYSLARAYEELENHPAAIRQYCRYLGLHGAEADAAEVQARVATLGASDEAPIPDEASRRFRMGVVNFDLDRMETAAESFAQVVETVPTFAPGHYNLGVTRVAAGQHALAVESLQRYLELDPDAADGETVTSAINALSNPARTYNPGAAMATSLFLPGTGQFISGRPAAGFAFLAAAAGAAAFGWFREDILIECRIPPTGGVCPPNDIVSEQRERPYLATGLGVAGAVALFAAIDAYRGASGSNRAARPAVTVAMGRGAGLRLGIAAPTVDRRGTVSLRLLRMEF